MERAHVETHRGIAADKLLQLMHETHWMYRSAAAKCRLFVEELTFGVDHVEDMRGQRRPAGAPNLRCQRLKGLGDITSQFDTGRVTIVEIRRQDVDVNDPALAF